MAQPPVGDPDSTSPPAGRRRRTKVAAAAAGVLVALAFAAVAIGGGNEEGPSAADELATSSAAAPLTTTTRPPVTSHEHASAATASTRTRTPLQPPAATATAAGCDEPDSDILATIEGSLTEGRTISEVAAVNTLVDGIEYTYTAGNVYKADGSRSVSGVVWVTPGFGVMGLSGNSRTVSTLPFGRGILDVSAGDEHGTKVQDCVSAIARWKNDVGGR